MTQQRRLSPGARERLDASDAERLRFIREDHWIGYPLAQAITGELTRLLEYPDVTRPPNLLLTGHTNNGKSFILRNFARLHPAVDDPTRDRAVRPVVIFDIPAVPSEDRLYNHLLTSLGAVFKYTHPLDQKFRQVVTLLRALETRVVVMDEVNNALSSNTRVQQQILNAIKEIGNELRRPIVLAGTEITLASLRQDKQMQNRFPHRALPRWQFDAGYLQLLASFESFLPLRHASNLASEALVPLILDLSDGLIGEMSMLIRRAAEAAIVGGEERITPALLGSLGWHSPRERDRLAGAIEMGLDPG